jgi:hypothetical protein
VVGSLLDKQSRCGPVPPTDPRWSNWTCGLRSGGVEAGHTVATAGGLAESEWNHALRSWFFRPDLAGRPAYLAVDEDVLTKIADELSAEVPDATESLTHAVRSRVDSDAPLGWWIKAAVRWKLSGCQSDPPFLSILAVSVLAATIVDDVNDRKYYRRLNALLGLAGVSMPRYFDSDVQQLWTYLNEWLTNVQHGQLGTATATNVGGLANVGWAQSQTLMRSSDRAKLPLLFAALGLQGGERVDGALLVRRLKAWSAGGQLISHRLAAVLRDTRLSELLQSALEDELATWDGTLRDESGRIALRLLLGFHERSGELQAAVHVPEQLAGTTWRIRQPAVAIDLGNGGEWQLLGIPITSEILDGQQFRALCDPAPSPRVRGQPPAVTVFMPRREVHLMCPDDRLARWVEVPSALLHRTHLVLLRSRLAAAGVEIMNRLGPDVQAVRRIRCPDGWTAYRFTPARMLAIDGPLAVLSPRGNELSALDGGLPISGRKRLYLTAGAPDLLLDLREPPGVITVDGAVAVPQAAGRLRLASLRLGPGNHAVSVGGVHYHVRLADEYADGPRDTRLSLSIEVYSGGARCPRTSPAGMTASTEPGPSEVLVSGAALWAGPAAGTLPSVPRPPRARSGGRHFALGDPGQVAEIRPQTPRWFQSLPVPLLPFLVDASLALRGVPFRAQWLLRASATGVSVSAVSTDEQREVSGADTGSAGLWPQILDYIALATPDFPEEAEAWVRWKRTALPADATDERDST